MLTRAKLKYLRISPRKVRRVAFLLKGKRVPEAEAQLKFALQRSATPLLKLLQSAAANAKSQFSLNAGDLVVKNVIVDGGPVLKRSLPRARGKVDPILKRTSHVEILLEGNKKVAPPVKQKKAAAPQKTAKLKTATTKV